MFTSEKFNATPPPPEPLPIVRGHYKLDHDELPRFEKLRHRRKPKRKK